MVVLSTAPSATTPIKVSPPAPEPKATTLWQLGIEAQELMARIAQLAEQLDAEDPGLQAEAIAELEAALSAEEGHRQALEAKADATCWVIEHLRAQGAYRSQQAKRLTELAARDGAKADRREASLLAVLTRLQPQATRFSFPHHELASRRSQSNRIFGFDGWQRETVEVRCGAERERTIGSSGRNGWGVTYTARVRVSVGTLIREGTGAGHGIDMDLGQAHESVVKEAETDAMKRALMTFGNPFGLALYDSSGR